MSTTRNNRSILAGIVSPAVTDTPIAATDASAPARVVDRMSTLARVTSGDIKEKTLELVDPARCRMWARHNRRYDLLDANRCSDLLESIRAQGAQEFPAIVRRVEDDSGYDFEVICGARRHWSVSYLRSVEHRDIKFLVEERDVSDEAAFRLSDVENRTRLDICDYERAMDYREAVETYYGGVAQRMAERLEVSKHWLSRFLDLAKLPESVVSAFGEVLHLRENHARELKPLLAAAESRPRVMAEAKRLTEMQARHRELGKALMDGPQVMTALKRAAAGAEGEKPSAWNVVANASGAPLFSVKTKPGRKLALELSLDVSAPNSDILMAFEAELTRFRAGS